MSIEHIESKIKGGGDETERPSLFNLDNDIFVVMIIIFVAFTSFGMGRLSITTQEKTPIVFSEKLPVSFEKIQASHSPQELQSATYKPLANSLQAGSIVASKNGTKYHFPWCSGAKRMKEENKIWFNSEQEAREAGYEPAANCKGLK
jgi:hypothetical protein